MSVFQHGTLKGDTLRKEGAILYISVIKYKIFKL